MTDRQTREEIVRWAKRSGCRLCVLFGSRARNRAPMNGDFDLALDCRPLPDADQRLEIISEIQAIVDPLPLDLTFLQEWTDPVLRFEIFRTGEPLYESRPGLFLDETVRALALFEDALPFRRALRERLRRRADEVRDVL